MNKTRTLQDRELVQISPLIERGNGFAEEREALHLRPVERPARNGQGMDPKHDFGSKLRQPEIIASLKEYVRWQAHWRRAHAEEGLTFEEALKSAPLQAPASINLDLTTVCNYRCGHCVDMDILNTGVEHRHEELLESLANLAANGLKSVILIGGGEPTAYKGFAEVVRHLKSLGIQLGIVTNGSLMKRVLDVADVLDGRDWVRLSLDSGTNDTFVRMHRPGNKNCTLEWICSQIRPLKQANPDVSIGFSFIIVWNDCYANDEEIIENVDEIVTATRLAKESGFDYISLKPFLTRAEANNAEIVEFDAGPEFVEELMGRIRSHIEEAKELEDGSFSVVESTNLRVFEQGTQAEYTKQPRNCHMQYFRQVLSPLGLYNCPVYRHVGSARIGSRSAYGSPESIRETRESTLRLVNTFDAAEECKEVTCLYNPVNWFIEDLISDPSRLESLAESEDRRDFFL